MSEKATDVQSFISKELHNLLFLEEFVFSRNKFIPTASSELELADAVVLLGDVLLVYQIKERSPQDAGDAGAERRWFYSKVLGKATKQVRDTLRYLQSYSEIRVPNERGHVFNLAGSGFTQILKIIVYRPAENLPAECRSIRHYVSSSAGFIHIVNASDYLELARTLRVPQDIIQYFEYREKVVTRFGDSCASLPEPAIAGHFIGGNLSEPPTLQSAGHLHRLVQDEAKWDLAPLMRGMHDHLSPPGIDDDYYAILIEFAKLPRSAWREVKERLRLCIEKVQKNEFALPYRIAYPRTSCGFVFVPITSEIAGRPDWPTVQSRGIQNFTQLHKYDQGLSKCIGVQVARDGEYFDIIWCLVDCEWAYNVALQRALDEHFPFRSVREAEVPGYVFTDK